MTLMVYLWCGFIVETGFSVEAENMVRCPVIDDAMRCVVVGITATDRIGES